MPKFILLIRFEAGSSQSLGVGGVTEWVKVEEEEEEEGNWPTAGMKANNRRRRRTEVGVVICQL